MKNGTILRANMDDYFAKTRTCKQKFENKSILGVGYQDSSGDSEDWLANNFSFDPGAVQYLCGYAAIIAIHGH